MGKNILKERRKEPMQNQWGWIFYKPIIQSVLIYGSEMISKQLLRMLKGFHCRCARKFITGKHIL
jgi:hypothetical protein